MFVNTGNSRHNGRCYDIDGNVIGVPSLAGEDSGERGATDQGLVLVPRLPPWLFNLRATSLHHLLYSTQQCEVVVVSLLLDLAFTDYSVTKSRQVVSVG